jgi:hypothetical protein
MKKLRSEVFSLGCLEDEEAKILEEETEQI